MRSYCLPFPALSISIFLPCQAVSQVEALYYDRFGPIIRLANEAETPFMFAGRTISETGNVERFRGSVRRYPSVQSCLVMEAAEKTEPDLSAIDWSHMRDSEDATVCLFRIASSYEDKDVFQSWLAQFGFGSFFELVDDYYQYENSTLLTASRDHSENGGRLIPYKLIERLFSFDYSTSISAYFSKDGKVISMKYSYTTL